MPDKIVRYINVYKDFSTAASYDTESEADSASGSHRIARVKLEEVERVTFGEKGDGKNVA